MLLGGTVTGNYRNIEEWEKLLIASRFKAITAPFNCHTDEAEIEQFCATIQRNGVMIAEVGVWKNTLDADKEKAAEAMAYAKGQLALADRLGVPCCVNIVGTTGPDGWDSADRSNFTEETYVHIIASIREIIDAVQPKQAFYCIEPMPWMVPDSPDSYVQLIRDVDRKQFGVHMDFVNMINCPRRYLAPEAFIEECFQKLGPQIKSTHIKDTRMHPTHLTTILNECNPGEGTLNYGKVLQIMDQYLPQDAPVLLEHMQTFEEYARAYDYVAAKAQEVNIPV